MVRIPSLTNTFSSVLVVSSNCPLLFHVRSMQRAKGGMILPVAAQLDFLRPDFVVE